MLFDATITEGKPVFNNPDRLKQLMVDFEGKEVVVEIKKRTKNRTSLQNRALHLYFTLLSDAMNDAGYTVEKTLKNINVPWSPELVKELLWRRVQRWQLAIGSTADLSTKDIDAIYDIVNMLVSDRTGVFVPFPSIEQLYNS